MKKNNKQIIAIALLVAFGLWLVFTVLPSGSGSGNNGPKKVGPVEPKFYKEAVLAVLDSSASDTIKVFDIELCESMNEIQYGMMYRKSMDPNTGMLFIMGEERRQSFYMKNTYVPLDIIYINDAMEIVSIQKNAIPLDESSLPSTGPASYVLEILGGESDKLGIAAGDKIKWQRWNK
tara:strand:+ start:212652 stop:213182 length:531 start_codon:yes stop_codon:yes gene_type:complete